MKKLSLVFLTVVLTFTSGLTTFAQNEKCFAFSNHIIKDAQGKILTQAVDFNEFYFIKAEVPSTYDIETIKTVCDTNAKSTKASYDWRLNYDKNQEKEYLVQGKKVLITFYPNDKILYFEFPKK